MAVGVLRHTLLHLCDLLGRRLALVLRFPLGKWHAVDDLARRLAAQVSMRLRYPVGQAVAAEAGQNHQIDVLHVLAFIKVGNQSSERGGFEFGLLVWR